MARWSLILSVAFLVAACARQQPAREPSSSDTDASLDDALAETIARETQHGAESRRMTEPDQERWRPKSISAEEPPPPPLGTRRFVNVRFAGADLEDALRFLAEAGGFAMIADGELSGRVDAELRQVRPYEALIALAQAHHAVVERRGAIVIVSQKRTTTR